MQLKKKSQTIAKLSKAPQFNSPFLSEVIAKLEVIERIRTEDDTCVQKTKTLQQKRFCQRMDNRHSYCWAERGMRKGLKYIFFWTLLKALLDIQSNQVSVIA